MTHEELRKKLVHIMLISVLCIVSASILVSTSCGAVGVADQNVVKQATGVADVLVDIYKDSESPELVKLYASIAINKLDTIPVSSVERMSDLDNAKLERLYRGIRSLIEEATDDAYVRQRALSLAALASSLGLYENSALSSYFENTEPQTNASDNP